jgi:cyclic-di-GMP-binding protein
MKSMSDTFLPTFRELADGGDYLAKLVLANPPVAEQQLIRFLDALLADPPRP